MMNLPTQESGEDSEIVPKPVLADLSVAIPTLGRPILAESIAAIADGDAWPSEVIVVHQGDDPEVDRRLDEFRQRGLRIRYIRSAERGRARGVNRGIEAASTRFVAITDDDCLAAPDWVVRMRARLEAAPDRIITGRVDERGDEPTVAARVTPHAWVVDRPRLGEDVLCGGNMGIARERFLALGKLDESPAMRTAEDCEFSYRALRAGTPIAYAPDVAVAHVGWRGGADRLAQYRSYARSHGGFYAKYLRRGDLFIVARVVVHHLRALRRWIAGRLTRDPERAVNGWAYLTGLLPGIVAGWRAVETDARGDEK
jgi:GT2 family glycosyltransferase